MGYSELQVTTNFTFLRGGSHPEELVQRAAALGYQAIAVTDHNTLAGVVQAHVAAKSAGIRLITGCRLNVLDGPSLLAYPKNVKGYANLSNLLTTGNLRTTKGLCEIKKADVFAFANDLTFIALPPAKLNQSFDFEPAFKNTLKEYKEHLGNRLYLGASFTYHGSDAKLLYRQAQLSAQLGIPQVATNDVYYHDPARRELQDILTCIREKCTISTAGFRLHKNAERYLKPEKELRRLFARYPHLIDRTQEIAEACTFSLDQLKYEYPKEVITEGRTAQEDLTILSWEGAKQRYPEAIPEKITQSILQELAFIEQMNYAEYFLTVYDIVRFCKQENILCQGRGSAANSTVCFCLGITSVDPTKFELLFERFASPSRKEPPDIDLDIEHHRREEVFKYIYAKYGRDRAAIVATVIRMHEKGAVRDVGRVMGLSEDTLSRLSAVVSHFSSEGFSQRRMQEQGLNPADEHVQKVLDLTKQYIGFPRQLGQHSGGFVISNGKLTDLVPILNATMEGRTCIEWDKNDIDALGFMKVDGLALGILTCIHKAFDLAKEHYDLDLSLASIPQDDPAVYQMITAADTKGVFQVESCAQQGMAPFLKPKSFYDIVVQVALVRPGPIIGQMVHPYLRRRNGQEQVTYPSPQVEKILSRTFGVPLFQEQAMSLAIEAAGFTGQEADALRRSMATFNMKLGVVKNFEEKLIKGMLENGYTFVYARELFRQLEGFGSYGFPESHAASFARLVIISAWLKYHYPDVFLCALLNSMPMGFWQVAELVQDAIDHGVIVRPVDINYSSWDNILEEQANQYHAVRLGLRQIKGIRENDIRRLLSGRKKPFRTVDDVRNTGISPGTLEKLADADAFRSIGLDRRQALWEVTNRETSEALFTGQPSETEEDRVSLPAMSKAEQVVHDYGMTALSLKAHPVSFVRPILQRLNVVSAADLPGIPDGQFVKVAGLVLIRQRPPTAKGVCFITMKDETGEMRMVIFANIFEQFREAILSSSLLMVEGRIQKKEQVIHVIATGCYNLKTVLDQLAPDRQPVAPDAFLSTEEAGKPAAGDLPEKPTSKRGTQMKLFPDARNFK